jgi:hypothetical protein
MQDSWLPFKLIFSVSAALVRSLTVATLLIANDIFNRATSDASTYLNQRSIASLFIRSSRGDVTLPEISRTLAGEEASGALFGRPFLPIRCSRSRIWLVCRRHRSRGLMEAKGLLDESGS